MLRVSGIYLSPDYDGDALTRAVCSVLGVTPEKIKSIRLHRRSVDARHKNRITLCIAVNVDTQDEENLVRRARRSGADVCIVEDTPFTLPAAISRRDTPLPRPVVIGGGPAGLFAALTLAKCGASPILMERGRPVEQRSVDVNRLLSDGILAPESNVQFGEGGAGAFSDGKLTTGIKNPRCRYILEELVRHGAPETILWDAKPHVGTDNLCKVVRSIREEIIGNGGTVLFNHKVTGITAHDGKIRELTVTTDQGVIVYPAEHVILAIGHSARDTVDMLYRNGVEMLPKPFAVGVRIEHPRRMIDTARYGAFAGHSALGAADYKLSCRVNGGEGAYSFCMCPGGVVIAAASEDGHLTVNGMSNYGRDAENSNSALLVGVAPEHYMTPDNSPLSGIEYQRRMEKAAYLLGGGGYRAPVQTVGDFLAGKPSAALGDVIPSYRPGVTPCDLRECLPPHVYRTLQQAITQFGRQITGFDRCDAVLTGVESRSSSPVRMTRDQGCRSSVNGLYPCGEGAGYAGGIMSAAADGILCAQNVLSVLV